MGLLAGFALSIVASVVANLLHSRILGFLDNRRLVSSEKRRRKAAAVHEIITELHEGKRNKYFYMLRLAMAFMLAATIGICALFSAITLMALSLPPTIPISTTMAPEMYYRVGMLDFLIFISL